MNKKRYKIGFVLGTVITLVLFAVVIMSFFYLPCDPNEMDVTQKFQAPSAEHFFGTDNYGRDVFSRTIEGLKTTFLVALFTVLIGGFVGVFIGAITGYYGGVLDEAIMRINDVLTSFPSILIAMVMVCIFGRGALKLVLIMGLIFIPSFARVMRGEFMKLRNRDFVLSAKLMGCSGMRIMFRHIFPNTLHTLLSSMAIGFNNAVLVEVSLSYLGIGVQPPYASLGRMLSEAQGYFSYIWCVLFPGLVMVLMILGFVLLSESAVRLKRR